MTAPVHEKSARLKTVLLVEDDAAVRGSLGQWLVSQNFEIVEAASGDGALNRCLNRKEPIDIAIIDMRMPDIWGDELAQRLAIVSPQTKVIFISGHTEDFLRSASALTGNEIFFPKPFSLKLMLNKIRELLGIEVPDIPAPKGPSATTGSNDPQPQPLHFTKYPDFHMEIDRHVE